MILRIISIFLPTIYINTHIVLKTFMKSCSYEGRKRPRKKSSGCTTTPIVENYCPYTSGFLASRLLFLQRRPAHYQWDCYYRNNTINGYKDRHYILREFVELQKAISSASFLSMSSLSSRAASEGETVGDMIPYSFSWMEVGCGVGNAFLPIFEQYGHLAHWKRMYAFDISSVAINLLREKVKNSFPPFLQQKVYLGIVDSSKTCIDSSDFLPVFLPESSSDDSTESIDKLQNSPSFRMNTSSTLTDCSSKNLLSSFFTSENISDDSQRSEALKGNKIRATKSSTPVTVANGTSILASEKTDFTSPPFLKHVRHNSHHAPHVSFASLIFVLSSVAPSHHKRVIESIAECLRGYDGENSGVIFFRDYAANDHAQFRFSQRRQPTHGNFGICSSVDKSIEGLILCSCSLELNSVLDQASNSTDTPSAKHVELGKSKLAKTCFVPLEAKEGGPHLLESPSSSRHSGMYDHQDYTSKRPISATYERSNGTLSHFFCIEEVRDLFTSSGFQTISLEVIEREVVNRKQKNEHQRRFIQGRFMYGSTKAISI